MNGANRFDWKHGMYTASSFASLSCVWLASDQGHATALALHISAALLAGVAFVSGFITHSLTSPALPPVVVAVDGSARALKAVADLRTELGNLQGRFDTHVVPSAPVQT